MVGFFIKLPFKLAFLPLRVIKKISKLVLGSEERGTTGGAGAWTSGSGSPPPSPPEPSGSSPFEVQVDPGSVIERMKAGETFTFIDVRQAQELAATGVIADALHIPTQDLPRRIEELDREAEIFVYCAAGVRSLDAVIFLREKGFENAWSLGGGLPHWQQDGGEVVTA
ncbi:MAG: rhodanese-like domain-containing protein [Myxococcota bacterium]|nr:rhodanese-like domain-containing protein [Myxococcota bacterium]